MAVLLALAAGACVPGSRSGDEEAWRRHQPVQGPIPVRGDLPGSDGGDTTTAPRLPGTGPGEGVTQPAPVTQAPTTAPPGTSPPSTAPGPTSWQLQQTPASMGGCQTFDRTSVFHSVVTGLPVHPRSDEFLGHIGLDSPVKAGIRSSVWNGTRPGIPFNYVDSRVTPHVPIVYPTEYPLGTWEPQVPMPANPLIEGDPNPGWDRHVLVLDTATCNYYELISYQRVYYDLFGIHWAAAGVKWYLGPGGALVPQRGTTVSAAPEVATLPRVDEVLAGRIDHVIGACGSFNAGTSVWPARNSDGTDPSPSAIPIGSRLRLKDTVDPTRFTGQARVIVEALRVHGLMITDTCPGALVFKGENAATGWDDGNLRTLDELRVGDFEVVDASPMMISEDSWQVR